MQKVLIYCLVQYFLIAQNGYEIAVQLHEKKTPQNLSNTMHMELTNSKNRIRNYKMRSKSVTGNRKQIIWFIEPKEDRGIAFLKVAYEKKEDEMKMWLPAFKKIRRISSKKKGDSFMGSDLSYEDLSSRDLEKNKYKRLEDAVIDGEDCFVLEIFPKTEFKSHYGRHISWISKLTFNIIKEESYNNKNELQKKKFFIYKEIKNYQILEEVHVENIKRDHSTTIKFTKILLNQNINTSTFNEKNLKRIPAG